MISRKIKYVIGLVLLLNNLQLFAFSKTDSDLLNRAEEAINLLQKKYQAQQPGISYLIAHKGKILASGGIGRANMEWNIPLTGTTLLRLGSISKSITAIATLKLVEQGKIELDVPISTYIPELPKHMGLATPRDLLSHRSGIADHAFDKELIPYIWQPMTTKQLIELQKSKKPEFNVGEKYKYVNFNYVLVAHLIEKVTNKSFVDFANEDIFNNYNLKQSSYDQLTAIVENRAEFYELKNGTVLNAANIDLSHVSAAGALLSSVQDMLRWMNLLTNGKIISRELLSEAWTAKPLPNGTETKYGLGFNISTISDQKYIWHTGLTPGAQAAYGYAVDSEIFVIVLSNLFYWPADTGKTVDEMMSVMLKVNP